MLKFIVLLIWSSIVHWTVCHCDSVANPEPPQVLLRNICYLHLKDAMDKIKKVREECAQFPCVSVYDVSYEMWKTYGEIVGYIEKGAGINIPKRCQAIFKSKATAGGSHNSGESSKRKRVMNAIHHP